MNDHSLIEIVLHLDKHLGAIIATYQGWTYGILALCIFCETGLVITPFLPGDTLLLAAGLFANPIHKGLNITILIPLLIAASILGDNTNFWIGRAVGKRLFSNPKSKVFNAKHLEKTRAFYLKHGKKTIIMGKWVAIVRTVAPFVAGMEAMPYAMFFPLSVISSVIWVVVCTLLGYYLGEIPLVRDNFEWVILGVLGITFAIIVLEVWRHKKQSRADARDKLAQTEPS
ncbi:MAG: VTT domain-containing protein [Armatimonadetes bacterium]|nr:VTT domain-containing protein [Armatimonadota bacterium]